ncbi:chemotaxis protein MotB [Neobacillus piezotolerans]|uniref:Chemotaxis protein MotB n=1 Tax=Neobacillus piezotolerans TaxID=2259171 RepID=A0A3D8GP15_9BACI|nr:flagellar motor protein MotB [Neobacillus piezotolerans]RDU35919.1 chemotaxis protein MotB [Neobacillus piezotolerans]
MRKRRKKFEHGDDGHIDESWLIPYADLLTLLLALFIVLYAASTIDVAKYQYLMESFKSELTGTKIPDKNAGLSPHLPTPETPVIEPPKEDKKDTELDGLKIKLENYIKNNKLQAVVSLQESKKGIEVSLKDVILFDSGKAELKPRSFKTLDGMVGLINTVPNPVSIEGHTDNVPATNTIYRTNWELSSARAASVLHYFESKNVKASRLQFSGFGEYHPLVPNDSDENRQSNRRVTIVILRQ